MLTEHARPRGWLIKFVLSVPQSLSVRMSVCLSGGQSWFRSFSLFMCVISELNVECSYALAHDLCGSCFLPFLAAATRRMIYVFTICLQLVLMMFVAGKVYQKNNIKKK